MARTWRGWVFTFGTWKQIENRVSSEEEEPQSETNNNLTPESEQDVCGGEKEKKGLDVVGQQIYGESGKVRWREV